MGPHRKILGPLHRPRSSHPSPANSNKFSPSLSPTTENSSPPKTPPTPSQFSTPQPVNPSANCRPTNPSHPSASAGSTPSPSAPTAAGSPLPWTTKPFASGTSPQAQKSAISPALAVPSSTSPSAPTANSSPPATTRNPSKSGTSPPALPPQLSPATKKSSTPSPSAQTARSLRRQARIKPSVCGTPSPANTFEPSPAIKLRRQQHFLQSRRSLARLRQLGQNCPHLECHQRQRSANAPPRRSRDLLRHVRSAQPLARRRQRRRWHRNLAMECSGNQFESRITGFASNAVTGRGTARRALLLFRRLRERSSPAANAGKHSNIGPQPPNERGQDAHVHTHRSDWGHPLSVVDSISRVSPSPAPRKKLPRKVSTGKARTASSSRRSPTASPENKTASTFPPSPITT